MDIEAFLTYYHEKGMDSKQYINIISDELEAVQQRITLNVQKTKHRQKYFNLCFDLIVATIILCAMLLIHHISGSAHIPLP